MKNTGMERYMGVGSLAGKYRSGKTYRSFADLGMRKIANPITKDDIGVSDVGGFKNSLSVVQWSDYMDWTGLDQISIF